VALHGPDYSCNWSGCKCHLPQTEIPYLPYFPSYDLREVLQYLYPEAEFCHKTILLHLYWTLQSPLSSISDIFSHWWSGMTVQNLPDTQFQTQPTVRSWNVKSYSSQVPHVLHAFWPHSKWSGQQTVSSQKTMSAPNEYWLPELTHNNKSPQSPAK